jgi:Flp pilus assembly protein TadD
MRRLVLLAVASAMLLACATGSSAKKDGVAHMRLALAQKLADRGDWAGALEAVEAACRSAPGDPEALTLRGIILRERGLLEEAEADLNEAVRRAPNSARAHSALALVHERQHRPADALEHHRRAVELAPKDARYLSNLGYAMLLHGDARKAIPILVEAVHADPTSRRARNNLGFAYARAGDFPRAAQQFAVAGTPAEAKNNLGLAFEVQGNRAQAAEHYRQALQLDPGLHRARENLDRLSSGGAPPAAVPTVTVPGALSGEGAASPPEAVANRTGRGSEPGLTMSKPSAEPSLPPASGDAP